MKGGLYSLIQYCPDPFRQESVNVGLVLLCKEDGFLDARVTRDHSRVKKMFDLKGQSLANLKVMEAMLVERILSSREELLSERAFASFAEKRVNLLRMTRPAYVSFEDPASAFQEMFESYTGSARKTS